MTATRIHTAIAQVGRTEVVHMPGDTDPHYRICIDGDEGAQVVLIGTEDDLTDVLPQLLAAAIDSVRPGVDRDHRAQARQILVDTTEVARGITRLPHRSGDAS